MGSTKVKKIKLIFLDIISKIGRIRITLHNPHIKELFKRQLHNSSTNLISQLLRILFLFDIFHCNTLKKLACYDLISS
jgi:hypothetical protein